MADIESLIQDSHKLTAYCGHWPPFHDAEVVELHFWRGEVFPGDWDDRNVFPVLTIKVHVLKATLPDASRDVLATLRFHDVSDFKMEGFNHCNMMVGLTISTEARGKYRSGEDLPPFLVVQFEAAFGMTASFRCFRIEVVDVVPCTEDGTVNG